MFSLSGKVALIIGGAGKIGSFIAEGYLEAGATVILASKNIKNFKK